MSNRRTLTLAWDGPLAGVHSLAIVNRQLSTRLADHGHVVGDPPEVTVRHRWPPDFTRPAVGKLVVILPWEFGRLPAAWVRGIENVDQVWVPSSAVRTCCIDSGVPIEKVRVVPNGVDPGVFRPSVEPLELATSKRFKFLFVGGTIWRKGFDLLLAAYGRAFSANDEVCLVVKDFGSTGVYRGQTAEAAIAEFRTRADGPELLYVNDELPEVELVQLYAACDCLVHPYRGEGFGLPVAEAMACGLPVIVTAGGATDDWCDDRNSFRVPSRLAIFPADRVGELETVGRPWVREPDLDSLVERMRFVFANAAQASARAEAGRATIHDRFTWNHAAGMADTFLEELMAPRPRVSLTMIVRDEERHLPACLRSVRELVDEIVIVDTGSSDQTKQIAHSAGAIVVDFPWVDDFAAARNAALERATGEWVFWMDADDRLDEPNRQRLKALFGRLGRDNAAYAMKVHCPGPTPTIVDHVRLFRNRPDVRWSYRVHEQILPAVRASGAEVRRSDVAIVHIGYREAAARQTKLDRDSHLLSLDRADRPDDPFVLYYFGATQIELGQPIEGIPPLRRCVELASPNESIVRKAYGLLVQAYRSLGDKPSALEICQQGRSACPDDAELLFAEAVLRREAGDRSGAEVCLKQLIEAPEVVRLTATAAGPRGFRAKHTLASLYLDDGRLDEAESIWRPLLAARPIDLAIRAGLGEVFIRNARWAELDSLVKGTMSLGGEGGPVAAILRGRALLARGDRDKARNVLGEAIGRYPASTALSAMYDRVKGESW